jgi:hypothetical protein
MIDTGEATQLLEAMTAIRSYAATLRASATIMDIMLPGMPDGPVKEAGTEMAAAYQKAAESMDALADSIRKLAERKP